MTASHSLPEEQEFVAVYSFAGTDARLGVGHSAILVNGTYYTYGSLLKLGLDAETDARADALADKDNKRCGFGEWRKIIIPVESKIVKSKVIESDIEKEWGDKAEYHLLNKNCANFVENYLWKLGILKTKKNVWIVLRPGEVEEMALQAGRQIVAAALQKERKQTLSESQTSNRLTYLKTLASFIQNFGKIEQAPGGIQAIMRLLSNVNFDEPNLEVNKLFCDVKKVLADINYASSLDKNDVFVKFSTNWFASAITVDNQGLQQKLLAADQEVEEQAELLQGALQPLRKSIKIIAESLKKSGQEEEFLNANLAWLQALDVEVKKVGKANIFFIQKGCAALAKNHNNLIADLETNKALLQDESLAQKLMDATKDISALSAQSNTLVSLLTSLEEPPQKIALSIADLCLMKLKDLHKVVIAINDKFKLLGGDDKFLNTNLALLITLDEELNKNIHERKYDRIQQALNSLQDNTLTGLQFIKKEGGLYQELQIQATELFARLNKETAGLKQHTSTAAVHKHLGSPVASPKVLSAPPPLPSRPPPATPPPKIEPQQEQKQEAVAPIRRLRGGG